MKIYFKYEDIIKIKIFKQMQSLPLQIFMKGNSRMCTLGRKRKKEVTTGGWSEMKDNNEEQNDKYRLGRCVQW